MQHQIKTGHKLSFLFLGSSSIFIQVGLLREALALMYGQELLVGIFLAVWMMLTAAGAWLGRFLRPKGPGTLVVLHLLVPVAALLALVLFPALTGLFTAAGSLISPVNGLLIITLLLMPACLFLGILFPVITQSGSGQDVGVVPGGYAIEGAGSVAGGLLLYLGLAFLPDNRLTWVLLTLSNYGLAWYLFRESTTHRTAGMLVIWMVAGLLVYGFLFPIHELRWNLLPNEDPVAMQDSPYGRMKATRTGGQVNIYFNGQVISMTHDAEALEEDVHFCLPLHPGPSHVLIISGGNPLVIDEVMKYPDVGVTYLEMDPWLYDFTADHLGFHETGRVNVIRKDPVLFLQSDTVTYDAILVLLPPPGNALLNRYYSREFILEARSRLAGNGLYYTRLPSTGHYLDDAALNAHSVLYKTLNSVFPHILVIPGGKNHFIASGKPVPNNVIARIEGSGMVNLYVNENYFDDALLAFKARQLEGSFDPEAGINTNLYPLHYRYQVRHVLEFLHIDPWPLVLVITALFLLGLLLFRPVHVGLFAGGFSLAAAQILLMILVQVTLGVLYYLAGIIITLFMGGLIVGTRYVSRMRASKLLLPFLINQAVIGSALMLLALLAWLINEMNLPLLFIHIFLYLMALIFGFLLGIHFSLAARLSTGSLRQISSSNYGIDLAGAALGTLLAALFLFPALGMLQSCLMLACLNVAAIFIIHFKAKKT